MFIVNFKNVYCKISIRLGLSVIMIWRPKQAALSFVCMFIFGSQYLKKYCNIDYIASMTI